jgi:predicted cupin superfamily sugar epimerase
MKDRCEYLIECFDLDPHPEGGYYRRTYESETEISSNALPSEYESSRRVGSSILYLLPSTEVSRLHRLSGDEMWHFYRGSPLTLHVFEDEGYRRHRLGNDYETGESPQYVVRAGNWFGATVGEAYALVGCTVWPEFQFEDFEVADRTELVQEYPEQERIIEKLTEQ